MATVRESPETLAKLASEMADDILALIRKHKLNSDTLPTLGIFEKPLVSQSHCWEAICAFEKPLWKHGKDESAGFLTFENDKMKDMDIKKHPVLGKAARILKDKYGWDVDESEIAKHCLLVNFQLD